MNNISIKKDWIRTDAWRGYCKLQNSVYSASLMYSHYSLSEVINHIKKIKQVLRKSKIKCRTVKTRTSNVFSTGIDIIVAQENFNLAQKIVEKVVE